MGRPDSTDPEIVSAYVLARFAEPDDEVAALIGRAADETERLVERLGSERDERLSELTTYDVDDAASRCCGSTARRPATRSTRRCSTRCSTTSRPPATTRRSACWSSSTDHMGLSAGADVREQLDEEGRVRRMELFAQLYDELTAFPKPTVAACHGACVGGGAEIAVACDLRVGGSNLRLRFPGAALGRPGRPRATGHALRPLGREVPAADRAGRRRPGAALGLVHQVAPAAATEEAALELAARSPPTRPRRSPG